MNQFLRTAPAASRPGQPVPEARMARALAAIPATSTGPGQPAELGLLALAAGRPDLAVTFIKERRTLQSARAELAASKRTPAPAPAAAATTPPVATAQPAPIPQSPAINAAAINARHRDVLAARQSGRTPSPVSQPPAQIHAAGGAIDTREVFRRHNQRGAV